MVFYISSATDIRAMLTKLIPVSDDDHTRFASLRRRKGGKKGPVKTKETANEEKPVPVEASGPPAAGSKGGGTDESLFGELDNAWESIFDEAEQNLKQDGV